MSAGVVVHAEVHDALTRGAPTVALETAVVTCGLPTEPIAGAPACADDAWDAQQPVHLEAARFLQRAVRAGGAVPAIAGVLEGRLHIGMNDAALGRLADAGRGRKAAARDLPALLAGGGSAGTTVSATLVACGRPPAGPIRVFATGGIGGVHRGWTQRPDVSSDLIELARRPVCVVCSGAKSILDLPATLEALETAGVPVLGFRTGSLPRFLSPPGDLPVPHQVGSAADAAAVCRAHWDDLGGSSSILLTQPVPDGRGLDAEEVERALAKAESEADRAGIVGAAVTPFLLQALVRRTAGRSLEANLALLAANARLAAEVAVALAG